MGSLISALLAGSPGSLQRYGDVALLLQQLVPGTKGHAEASTKAVLGAPAVPEIDELVVGVDSIGDNLVAAANRRARSDLDQAGLGVGAVEAGVPVDAGYHRTDYQGLECMLDAESVAVGGDHPQLLGRLADHEAGAAGVVGRVGLSFQLGFELVDPHGVGLAQCRASGEVRRGVQRTTQR